MSDFDSDYQAQFNKSQFLKAVLFALLSFLLPFLGFVFFFSAAVGKVLYHSHLAHSLLFFIVSALPLYAAYYAYRSYSKNQDVRVFALALTFFIFGLVFFGHSIANFYHLGENIFDITEHYGLFLGSLFFLLFMLVSYFVEKDIYHYRREVFLIITISLLLAFWQLNTFPSLAETLENNVNFFIATTGIFFLVIIFFLLKKYREKRSILLSYLINGFAILVNTAIVPLFYEEWNLLWWYFHLVFVVGFAVILIGLIKEQIVGRGFDLVFIQRQVFARIGKKLVGGFVTVSLLVSILGLVSWQEVNKVEQSYKQLSEDIVPMIINSTYIEHYLSFVRVHVLSYLISSDTKHLDALKQTLKQYYYHKNLFMNYKTGVDSNIDRIRKSFVDTLNQDEPRFVDLTNQLINLKDRGGLNYFALDQIGQIPQIKELEQLERKLIDIMEERIAFENSILRNQESELDINKTQARELILFASFLIIFIGIVIGFYLSQAIANRIQNLVSISEKIIKGDLKARVIIDEEDEIGDLSRSFNLMTESLVQLNEQAKLIMGAIPEPFFVLDKDCKIISVNKVGLAILGYTAEELIGHSIKEILVFKKN